jgi:hypothetical protein
VDTRAAAEPRSLRPLPSREALRGEGDFTLVAIARF